MRMETVLMAQIADQKRSAVHGVRAAVCGVVGEGVASPAARPTKETTPPGADLATGLPSFLVPRSQPTQMPIAGAAADDGLPPCSLRTSGTSPSPPRTERPCPRTRPAPARAISDSPTRA
ncbi:hypothetical protein AAFF_G00234350 [Aldrovandia affinis]|uniref:Uncharacterized protein n=1 Tax=Aldrovandia affinis TaxID=143900 RepID=A0AAD7SW34_9TELE|nr:hypothetical protein AAFF_G00234350 [Aldrovandia affinis]